MNYSGGKAVNDVKVEQCDVEAAEELFGLVHLWRDDGCDHLRSIASDKGTFVAAFARHRQAAEKATRERDAGIADAHRQARLEAAKNALARKAKSEARDHETMAIEALHIATAIRSQNDD